MTHYREVQLCTAEEEQDLARRIRAGDRAAYDELVERNLPLVRRLCRRFWGTSLFDDAVQQGDMGLMKAAEKFDPDRGVRFSSYAAVWIRQYIQRYRGNDRTIRVPNYLWHVEAYRNKPHHPGRDDEGAEKRERRIAAAELASMCPVSLSRPINNDEDTVADGIPDPEDDDDGGEDRELIGRLMSVLEPRAREIIAARFGIGRDRDETLQEIGDRLGITRERVRQLERDALEAMRRELQAAGIA